MDRFGPTGKVSKKRVHLLRWTTRPVKGYRILKTTCVFEVTDLHLAVVTPLLLCRQQKILHSLSQQSLVVTVSLENAVSIMKTKQPVRIVLSFFCSFPQTTPQTQFLLCPSPCRKRDWVTTVTQLFDKMAAGSIPNKGIRDTPHSSLSCFAMRLKPGQEIRECLLSYVKENNLKAPFVLSCVGSVASATLRLPNASKDTPNEVS